MEKRKQNNFMNKQSMKEKMKITYPSKTWQDQRIEQINKMPYASNEDHPCFDEVMAIYESNEKSYKDFLLKNPQLKNE